MKLNKAIILSFCWVQWKAKNVANIRLFFFTSFLHIKVESIIFFFSCIPTDQLMQYIYFTSLVSEQLKKYEEEALPLE